MKHVPAIKRSPPEETMFRKKWGHTGKWTRFLVDCYESPEEWMRTPWPVSQISRSAIQAASDLRRGILMKVQKKMDGTWDAVHAVDTDDNGLEHYYVFAVFYPSKNYRKRKK